MTSAGEHAERPDTERDDAAGVERTVDARIVRTRNDILGAAYHLLVEQGWESVTHPHLARVAGYSRATVYKHWPTRADLLRDVFIRLEEMPHSEPTGDLRADLIAELSMFRREIETERLDRALAVLADLAASNPQMNVVRAHVATDGEHVVRGLLATVTQGPMLEAATLMLCGAVLNAALMHGRVPDDDVIAAAVDVVLGGLTAGAATGV